MSIDIAGPWQFTWNFKSKLSQGGQGFTYLVEKDGVQGVLKALKSQNSKKARGRMHVEVEALKVLSSTSSAKIPKVLDENTAKYSDPTAPLFFVMEYIPGKNLRDVVSQSAPWNLDDALSFILDLCETVKAAHAVPILHRDIKPDNIIVSSDNKSGTLVDFGLAYFEDKQIHQTRALSVFETNFINLPEFRVEDGDKHSPASDATCIALVLHYCLTKCVPHELEDENGRKPHERKGYTLESKVTDSRKRSLLNALFDKAFTRNMGLRFQTVNELSLRIIEITDPDLDLPVADPKEEITAIARDLLGRNTQVRNAHFLSRAGNLSGEVRNAITALFDQRDSFELSQGGNSLNPESAPNGFTKIENICVWNLNHKDINSLKYGILIALFSSGDEAMVCKSLSRHFHKTLSTKPQSEVIEGWSVIMRYNGFKGPETDVVVEHLRRWMPRVVARLSKDIQDSIK